MRRLTYREYDHMLADLLGDTTAPAEGGNAWSPDAPNAVGYVAPDQRRRPSGRPLQPDRRHGGRDGVPGAGRRPDRPASSPSPARRPRPAPRETTCATQFITAFGLEAYRRPVAAAEQTDLLALFTKVRGLGLSFNESHRRPRQGDDSVAELPLPLGDRADQAGGRRRWPRAADLLAARLSAGVHHLGDDARRHAACRRRRPAS